MSFNKISLFSFILVTSFSVIAMEETQQSIQQKLTTLDLNIIKITKALKLAEKQKNNDKIAYDKYLADYNNSARKWYDSWYEYYFSWQPQFDRDAPEVCTYKGGIVTHSVFGTPIYGDNGSEGKYNKLLAALSKNQNDYSQFKNNFKRGKKSQDFDYLKIVDQDVQNYLNQNFIDQQKINEQ